MTKRTKRVRKKRTQREQRPGSGHKLGHSATADVPTMFGAPPIRQQWLKVRDLRIEIIPTLPTRHFFTGPLWLIELMREVYGDAIDYVEQKPIPVKR